MATYRLFNINQSKLENVIHRVFGRLETTITDLFGNPVRPERVVSGTLSFTHDVIEKIKDGSIGSTNTIPAKYR